MKKLSCKYQLQYTDNYGLQSSLQMEMSTHLPLKNWNVTDVQLLEINMLLYMCGPLSTSAAFPNEVTSGEATKLSLPPASR